MSAVDRAASLMRLAGCSELLIKNFTHQIHRLENGTKAYVGESELAPLNDLPVFDDSCPMPPDAEAAQILGECCVLKLAGGLGTTMGLSDPKFVIKLRDNLSFLEVFGMQLERIRERFGKPVRTLMMSSFVSAAPIKEFVLTHETLLRNCLQLADGEPTPSREEAGRLYDERCDVRQGMVPKLFQDTLFPAAKQPPPRTDDESAAATRFGNEWCPPGHGDLWITLAATGRLKQLLAEGKRYMFISNADNLAATADPRIPKMMKEQGIDFLLETCSRTQADVKGSHVALRKAADGSTQFIVRELAQCLPRESDRFYDVNTHKFFNTNSLWVDLEKLDALLQFSEHGFLDLPTTVNPKHLNPIDSSTPKIVQLETPVAAAIAFFPNAKAVLVPRTRFSPVKHTSDLLALRSDAFAFNEFGGLSCVNPKFAPRIILDSAMAHFNVFEQSVGRGAIPSLKNCRQLMIRGSAVMFNQGVIVEGDVTFDVKPMEQSDAIPRIAAGKYANGEFPVSTTAIRLEKRNGELQVLDEAKLLARLQKCCLGLDTTHIDLSSLQETIVKGAVDGMKTSKIDELAAQVAAYVVTKHPYYGLLGGRLAVSALHKVTESDIVKVFERLYANVSPRSGLPAPIVSEKLIEVVRKHGEELQNMIDYSRDFNYDFFGFKTLEKSYLLRIETSQGKTEIVERPQHMLLRVAVGIHLHDIAKVRETYELLSQGWFTHASPTLFNAGTPKPQMSSCFLLGMKDDSIDGIFDSMKQCANISKSAGGIGIHVSNLRCNGSYIAGTNGTSSGLVPILRVLNNTARWVDQGGGKRKGAFAVYLEPWHADISDFLDLKKNNGKEENRARDLFYALWIPDLFMKRVEASKYWTLFDPNVAKGLADCYGEEFERKYEAYEREGLGTKTIRAQDLWFQILESQVETGTPYMLYKDAANKKSNQKNLGTIKCSNLCTEIIEFTAPDEVAVCNLASIALPKFVDADDENTPIFDHKKLHAVTKIITRNLNRVIDENHYPVEEARRSNMRHRPIGLGVQGLADTFLQMRMPFTSPEAQQLNAEIFETIYHAAVEASVELAKEQGAYNTFQGSPASQGKFQFELWEKPPASKRWDWETLRKAMVSNGMRNSLLVAPMPTAATSQILGNNECIEPFTSNIYVRRVLSGEFPVVNKHLVLDLVKRGLWNDDLRQRIIAASGSVQNIEEIPSDLKKLYKVVWEIRQKDLIDMAASRGRFIDQSQSLNLFLESPKPSQLTSMHFYAWRQGLKTGMYYLRSRPAVDAIKFTVDSKHTSATATPNRRRSPPRTSSSAPGSSNKQAAEEGCVNCGS